MCNELDTIKLAYYISLLINCFLCFQFCVWINSMFILLQLIFFNWCWLNLCYIFNGPGKLLSILQYHTQHTLLLKYTDCHGGMLKCAIPLLDNDTILWKHGWFATLSQKLSLIFSKIVIEPCTKTSVHHPILTGYKPKLFLILDIYAYLITKSERSVFVHNSNTYI